MMVTRVSERLPIMAPPVGFSSFKVTVSGPSPRRSLMMARVTVAEVCFSAKPIWLVESVKSSPTMAVPLSTDRSTLAAARPPVRCTFTRIWPLPVPSVPE
jgi:hypothetical protein